MGAINTANIGDEVNGITNSLDDMYGGAPEGGDLAASNFGVMWQSHSKEGHGVLYYSARRDIQVGPATRHTWKLTPEVKVDSPAGNLSPVFDEANIFYLTPSVVMSVNPTGTFPQGHVIEIKNANAAGVNTVTFQGVIIGNNEYARFVYDGSAWQKLLHVLSL
jgi:hypothetical protein